MAQLPTRNESGEPLVISRTEEGFRVYSPAEPTKSYIVAGGPDEPTCTCPEFQYHEGDPKWQCAHIQAVLQQLGLAHASGNSAGFYDTEERTAIQAENSPPEKPADGTAPQMVLKRSVSRTDESIPYPLSSPALWQKSPPERSGIGQ
jgi:hypothetical protein